MRADSTFWGSPMMTSVTGSPPASFGLDTAKQAPWQPPDARREGSLLTGRNESIITFG